MLRAGGIDRAVAFTLVSRGWTALSGFITLFLLTHFLSSTQQGFYYTFADILALQVFFELGLAAVIIQYVSHERAHLEWTPEGTLHGDPVALARLASILRMSLLWYGAVSLLVFIFVLPFGLYFFSHNAPLSAVMWQLPWVWIVLVTSASLALSPLLALLEGCGLVADVAGMQVRQNFVASILFWAALVSHWGLYTTPISGTVVVFWSTSWLWRRHGKLIRALLVSARRQGHNSGLDWKREVWPFQWRIAVSWLCGYFIFKLFNPILFACYGPVAAGRMGLSLNVMTAISTLALAWVTTKSAPFGTLIARREYGELDRRFFPCMWQSVVVIAVAGMLFWSAGGLAQSLHWKVAIRLLPPLPLALLIGSAIVNHVLVAEAIYLRAHKQEPFLILSLATGISMAFSSIFLGRQFGAGGMMAGYFVISSLALIGGTWIFQRKRAEWHPGQPDAREIVTL